MNYRINSTKIGIKDFYIKKLIAIDNNIEKLKKELQKEKKNSLNVLRISKERANAIRKLTPKKKHTGYIILEIKLNFYENKPLYKYKLETPFFSNLDIKMVQEIIVKDLEKTLNLKITFLNLKNVINRDDYIFYLMISKNINKEFYQIEFVTTKYLEKEQITLK